ncbi:3940_t:CDS:2 [Entrophospora sp. SA101]|nr:3940_t:CDS:2 [Entrophospora sp. SA101]
MPKEGFTHCVVIDKIDGVIQQCKSTNKMRRLGQLVGAWEVDETAVRNCDDVVNELGVCYEHFLYDQNSIHSARVKQDVNIEKSHVQFRRCLFCKKNKAFFTRRKACIEHCWSIVGKNIQLPCNAQYKCKVFSPFNSIASKSRSDYRPQFVCCSCFALQGGHLEPRPRKGPPFKLCNDHDNDASSSLQYISKWILEVSHGSDQEYKKKVLNYLVPSLAVFNKDSSKFPENVKTEPSESTQSEQSEEIKVPHLFLIKTILKLAKVNLTDEERASNLTSGEFYNQGKTLALAIWKNKNILSENSEQLSQPESLEKYINAFPPCLTSFFGGMVETINIKKQLQRRNQIPDPNNNQTIKTTAFLSSVVITNAFKKRKIWITQILATLCRKPKLLSSLYQVLLAGGVLPHTLRHERRCEDELMMAADPRKNLVYGPTIWSVGVIDNIDFKESTFFSGNIFDATRNSLHAIARISIQLDLQEPLDDIMKRSPMWPRTIDNLFGPSEFIEEWNNKKNCIFSELLKSHEKNLDAHHIHDEITNYSLENSTIVKTTPNVVILKAGPAANCDRNVFATCDLFKEDLLSDEAEFQNRYNKRLDLVADEAIFRRLVRYNKDHPEVIPMLGQFHTSREMLVVLISAFSGYGIFDLAAKLGSKFLDKLDDVVDYRATSRTIELLWVLGNIKTRASSKKDIISHKWTDISKDNNKSKKGKKSNLNEQPIPMIIDNDDIQNASSSTSDAPPLQAKKPKHMASPAEKEILRHLASFQETLPNDAIDSVLESLFQLDPNYWDKKKVKDYWRLNLGPNKRKKKSEMDMES